MKKLKRIMVLLIFIVITISSMLIIHLTKTEQKEEPKKENTIKENSTNNEIEYESEETLNENGESNLVNKLETDAKNAQWEEVKEVTLYYAIKDVVIKYYQNLSTYNTKESKVILKDMLRNYINIKSMDEKNFETFCNNYTNKSLNIQKLYYKYLGGSNTAYYIQGILNDNNSKYDIILIMQDPGFYTILPNEYILEKYGQNISNLSNNNIDIDNNMLDIIGTDNNKASYNYISLEEMTQNYFNDYIYNLKNDTAKLYDTLDEKYKRARFGSYDEFKNYIDENYEDLVDVKIAKYKVDSQTINDAILYICQDQYGDNYIFKATAVMNYTLFLDDYTVEIE